jgi:uncharacterized protein YigE (DUF2233 family)
MKFLLLLFMLSSGFHTLKAGTFSKVEHQGKTFTLFRLSAKNNPLQLYLKDALSQQTYKSFTALNTDLSRSGEYLFFAMNGGMFHSNFSPVGLFIAHHKMESPLNVSLGKGNFFLKPNGVFAWSESQAWILESSAYAKKKIQPTWATQSGPMMVIQGRIHPLFDPQSKSTFIRNGVGLTPRQEIIFCISDEPVNFHQMASVFKNGLSCPNALYLDGSISSLFSETLRRNDQSYKLGPIIAFPKKINGK